MPHVKTILVHNTGFDLCMPAEVGAPLGANNNPCFIPPPTPWMCWLLQVWLKCIFCYSNTELEPVKEKKVGRVVGVKSSFKSGCIPCDLTWSKQMKEREREIEREEERVRESESERERERYPHKTISAFSSNRSYHLHDNSRNGNMEIY